jgi:transmembrane sensor
MKISPEEFNRYSKGLSSKEERQKIEIWLEQAESEDLQDTAGEEERLDLVWEKLKSHTERPEPLSRWRQSRSLFTKVAATLLLVAGFGWFFLKVEHPVTTATTAGKMKTVVTGNRQRLTVTLPDGSVIQMNTSSELSYPEKFTGKLRLVKFNGEALFSIARNEAMPFVIKTDSVSTKVLGTKFNLRSYRNEKMTALTVLHGKVQFGRSGAQDEQLILTKDMQGMVIEGKKAYSRIINAEKATGWQSNTFDMDDQRLDVVAEQLATWYGVKVVIQSEKLKSVTVTGTYKNASLIKIMEGLAYSTGLKYKYENQVLVIY